jgi:hypothetical protein
VIGYWGFLIENYRQQRVISSQAIAFQSILPSSSSRSRIDNGWARQDSLREDTTAKKVRVGVNTTPWGRHPTKVRLFILYRISTSSPRERYSSIQFPILEESRLRGSGADCCLLAALFPSVLFKRGRSAVEYFQFPFMTHFTGNSRISDCSSSFQLERIT